MIDLQKADFVLSLLPVVGIIVGLKYLVYVLMYVYYQLGGVRRGAEGRGVSACVCVCGLLDKETLTQGGEGD